MINNALYTSTLGSIMSQKRLDVLANNLANASTPGFKVDRTSISTSASHISSENFDKNTKQLKNIDQLLHVSTQFSQGPVKTTAHDLDIAINGEGFFELQGPDGPLYTRNGAFRVNGDGYLVNLDGYPVMGEGGPIEVPENDMVVRSNGEVLAGNQSIDRLKVVDFENRRELTKQAGTTFLANKAEPKTTTEFSLVQGALEMSNVNPIRIMAELIDTSRNFDTDMKAVESIDKINQKFISNNGKTK